MPRVLLADCRGRINLPLTDRGVRPEGRSEVYPVAGPSRDQTFRVGNSRLCVLHDVALDVAPLAVAIGGVTLCAEVDGEDSVLTEDIGTEGGQARGATVVDRLGDEVALEEMHARRRQFNHFSQIDADQLIHAGLASRGVLQDVNRAVVRVVSQNVAEGERMDVIVFGLNQITLNPASPQVHSHRHR